MIWPKNAIFLYFCFIKIRLEIMLSDFQEKKQTFFGLKKTVRIFESPENRISSKGLTMLLEKIRIFSKRVN